MENNKEVLEKHKIHRAYLNRKGQVIWAKWSIDPRHILIPKDEYSIDLSIN